MILISAKSVMNNILCIPYVGVNGDIIKTPQMTATVIIFLFFIYYTI